MVKRGIVKPERLTPQGDYFGKSCNINNDRSYNEKPHTYIPAIQQSKNLTERTFAYWLTSRTKQLKTVSILSADLLSIKLLLHNYIPR